MAYNSVPVTLTLATITVLALSGVFKYVAAQDQADTSDPTPFLESAKTHLAEAANDLKNGSSQAASTEINLTHQAILAAEKLVNSSVICDNINNLGFCAKPDSAR